METGLAISLSLTVLTMSLCLNILMISRAFGHSYDVKECVFESSYDVTCFISVLIMPLCLSLIL